MAYFLLRITTDRNEKPLGICWLKVEMTEIGSFIFFLFCLFIKLQTIEESRSYPYPCTFNTFTLYSVYFNQQYRETSFCEW